MAIHVDLLVVGSGFAGSVLAERCAEELGWNVLVAEKRGHVGGNAHDQFDRNGVLIHSYGPHWFRTNSDAIVNYLSRFTDWHKVDYKILSSVGGRLYPFPINLDTFNAVYGLKCDSAEMEHRLQAMRVSIENPANSEEAMLAQVGEDLYRKFYLGYTRKQWGCEPRDLDASVCRRIPVRTNQDDRYFNDKFQALPRQGYHKLFEKLLLHPRIRVLLYTDYRDLLPHVIARRVIYTGPVDAFFDHRFGRLPYRSLKFEAENLNQKTFQAAMQVNYPNENDFTRIVEYKHATGQKLATTTIVREYPRAVGDPYYPIPAPASRELYEKYAALAMELETQGVHFVGRLATYRYYNMDQVIGMALTEFEKIRRGHSLARRRVTEIVSLGARAEYAAA